MSQQVLQDRAKHSVLSDMRMQQEGIEMASIMRMKGIIRGRNRNRR